MRLIPATVELVDLELSDPNLLAGGLGARAAADWPPEHHGRAALERAREQLSAPDAAGWWLHYFVVDEPDAPVLIGVGGLKGPPLNGVVEIGYSVVPSAQNRGYATVAARSLIESAADRGATVARAETLPALSASIRVLEKLGFEPAESAREGVIAFERRL